MRRDQSQQLTAARGSIYFIVLAVCLLVAVIGLGAVLAARVQTRAVSQLGDYDQARLHARSAVELATYLANQANFRSTYSNGTWITRQAIGNGAFTIAGSNANANLPLNDWDNEPVNLTTTGYNGSAVHISHVQLVAHPTPFNCLQTCADFGGAVTLGSLLNTTNLSCNQPFSTNSTLTGITANINAPLESAGLLSLQVGCTGTYTTTTLSTARTLPDPVHVFDYYTSHGTTIPASALYNSSSGSYMIQNCLLSPANNPFGPTDPNGIYIINLGSLGGAITIQNCRIVGTLVILNANGNSQIAGSVNWAPATVGYPCLLVQSTSGSAFALNYSNAALVEAAVGVNLNPPSTPYNGVSNTTTTDAYPSQIAGLMYFSGNLTVSNYATVRGTVIANGSLTFASGTLSITYDPTYASLPPPGFYQTPCKMVVSTPTFAQGSN